MTVLAIVNCEVTPVISTMIRLTSWNDLCFLQPIRCESDGGQDRTAYIQEQVEFFESLTPF